MNTGPAKESLLGEIRRTVVHVSHGYATTSNSYSQDFQSTAGAEAVRGLVNVIDFHGDHKTVLQAKIMFNKWTLSFSSCLLVYLDGLGHPLIAAADSTHNVVLARADEGLAEAVVHAKLLVLIHENHQAIAGLL